MRSPSTHSTCSSNTGTIRHRHKKSRPAPPPPVNSKNSEDLERNDPSEICIGANNSIKSHWRHQPILLITGVVKYSANVSQYICITCNYLKSFVVFGFNLYKRI